VLRVAAVIIGVGLLIANLANALHKGGDFDVYLVAGSRLLTATPLYEGTNASVGVTGPPAYALVFAPFAIVSRASLPAARIAWYLVGLTAFALGVWAWSAAFAIGRWPEATAVERTTAMIWALFAIVLPVQVNFEHQNMNPVLLCLTGFAGYLCVKQRDAAAGVFVGVATAIKAFPAVMIVYLACARRWRAAMTAAAGAAALTALTMIVYGLDGGWNLLRTWMVIASGDWPVRGQNQSLYATASRFAPASAATIAMLVPLAVATLLGVIAFRRRRDGRTLATELAITLACGVLASPVAWTHYAVLLFPALMATYLVGAHDRWARGAFWVAAMLLTGLSPITLGTHGFNVVRAWSPNTMAALLIVGVLVRQLSQPRARSTALRHPA
jgi:alpha-1,2-mannosyltransferase